MRLTRRSYSSLASSFGIAVLAGCLNPPETDSSENGDDQQDATDQQATVTQADIDQDPFYTSIEALTEFVRWKGTEYESAISSYRDGLRTVERRLEALSEREMRSISQSALDDVFDAAAAASSTDDGLETYYDTAPNLSGLARNLEADLQRNFDRSEYEQLASEINDYQRTYASLTTSTTLSRWFPSDPVYGRPYQQFISADDPAEYDDYIFETMVANDADEITEAFFTTYDQTNISGAPFNYAPDSIVSSNRQIAVDEFVGGLIDRTAHDIQFEYRVNIIRQSLYDAYPDEYFETDQTVSVSESDGVGVVVYELENRVAAEELYNEYLETGTVDSQIEIGEEVWDRVFFAEESQTVYTHVISRGEYVICMDVTDTQWEDRSFGEEDASLEEVVEGTVVYDPTDS